MTPEEEEVVLATKRFYDALEQMMSGKGLAAMEAAWHHGDAVTSGHPAGEWAHGWDEVLATWQVFDSFVRPNDAGGSEIRDIRPHVFGDVAYTTGAFVVAAAFGGSTLKVTNVLRRIDGVWKIIHHHADSAPRIEQELEARAARA
ncbi:MAG: SnoaL-like domain-containing protein [Polyangiaceae bacterium]|nr:SnoaL-like domain-containing protein [Polyangiaceae bacterium]